MNVFKGILFMAVMVFSSCAIGQDAKAILNKVSDKVKAYDAMYVEYSMELNDDKAGGLVAKENGKAWLKNEKFKIETPDFHIYTDGASFWAYSKEDNMCAINDFEEIQEEKGFSPSDLFTIWETGFKHEYKGKSAGLTQINLYPTDNENPFHTIQMYVNESTNEIEKAIMKSRDGQEMTYVITTFKGNPAIADSDFKFKESNYPGVEMDDQRF